MANMLDYTRKVQYMDGMRGRFRRLEAASPSSSVASEFGGARFRTNTSPRASFGMLVSLFERTWESFGRLQSFGHSFLHRGRSKMDYHQDLKKRMIFDPQSRFLVRMNRFFMITCIIAVAIDPLFLYLPIVDDDSKCIKIDRRLAVASTIVRTIVDAVFLIHVCLKFRTAYAAPSTGGFGTGELVRDTMLIAKKYLRTYFAMDLISVLPLPQIVVWRFLAASGSADVRTTKDVLLWIILLQYVPRLLRIFALTADLKRSAGVFIETAWAGAAYYLLWFMLAGHNVGTCWYMLSLQRENDCWHIACENYTGCETSFLYCGIGSHHSDGYENWKNASTQVLNSQCSTDGTTFNYGIYLQALQYGAVSSTDFVSKVCFCFWWGLQNMSTLGQGLMTSAYTGEVIFSIAICILGLLLFALLIGNMQTYLKSLSIRLEEMRVKKRDAEQWMHHRFLPPEVRERVRRYERFRWLETRGVDEDSLVQTLPKDLRRDIKRHLCLGLVKRVAWFENMDEQLLDAICERLKPTLYIEGSYIIREGDPVDEMLFIVRGSLESITTDGGRSGFYNSGLLKEGDFCGEELLNWALDPRSSANFPPSTRTVKALGEVEAFALGADELKFVATQFRRLHNRQVQHTFRFYSQHWKTWAACFIQAAWRRYYKRKMAELRLSEEKHHESTSRSNTSLGAAIYASRFAANAIRGVHRLRGRTSTEMLRLQKPPEPDFGVDDPDYGMG